MSDRRRFLRVLALASVAAACGEPDETTSGGTGLTGGVGGAGGAMAEPELPPGFELVGNVSGLPVGALVEGVGKDLLFGRDAAGVYAMTSRCTHQQCNMINNEGIVAPGVIRCACHGSRFDAFGSPIQGPATAALAHFAVVVDDNGYIGVDASQEVEPSTRAPVPAGL